MNEIYILKKNREFNKIIKEGNKRMNSHFIVYYLPSLSFDIDTFRVGISVGKKMGNAPYRNYEKRVIRSIITQNTENIVKYDYVVIARPHCKEATFELKSRKLLKLFKEIK